MKTVYILWQDKSHSGRMWHAVAKLVQTDSDSYLLNYTKGAKNPRFQPFPRMGDMSKQYKSDELFTFLKNRIPPASRPEHESLFEWCNLGTKSSYLELLAVSGGEKVTDNYRIISLPENKDGKYINTFFVSGVRYLNSEEKSEIENFKSDQLIEYKFEDNNINDSQAILLFDKIKNSKIGYYPRYLTDDLRKLHALNSEVKIQIVKVNTDAPEQFRLLCKTVSKWPSNFKSCDNIEYQDFK
ncbi:hypothetical protein [Acinetobacter radioresistens]|uniref:hypothetical protein n=1 Tax=Acinetobacter radioresistens TaxID=40216 RepID=UPI002005D867|nr:hypothetical protein [Acinetobacter radioresistens]MCK4082062.1 hypothetical protein [Acinetobacter radioresistens]